jgi:hypothetical protein
MEIRCPGQDLRYVDPEDVRECPCPGCGRRVEFFRDDVSRKCPYCGVRFKNPGLDRRCASWCAHAKECVDFDTAEAESEPRGGEREAAPSLAEDAAGSGTEDRGPGGTV